MGELIAIISQEIEHIIIEGGGRVLNGRGLRSKDFKSVWRRMINVFVFRQTR